MTLPQIWNALRQGEPPPDPTRQEFTSFAEARMWKEEMRARIAAAKARKEAGRHRAEVAESRRQRRGY